MAETRKLAAILRSDVVGYSRLASADEDRILARFRALRSDLIDPTIAVHASRGDIGRWGGTDKSATNTCASTRSDGQRLQLGSGTRSDLGR
jgi:class 3 adenylate cyclase